MSSKDPASLIRSTNPNDRMQGVKMVARLQNERALRVLLQLANNDENPEVRAFARKGAKYVAKKMDEAGRLDVDHVETQVKVDAVVDDDPPIEEDYDDEPQGEVEVSQRQIDRAQGYLDEATDHHMAGRNDKAVKAMSKAVETNPNLRLNEYFKSLATSVTGMEGADAIRSLTSSKKRQVLLDANEQKAVSAGLAEHMSEANKHTWGTLGIDLGILSAIVFLGMFFSVLLVNYTGNSWVTRTNGMIEEARANPDIDPEEVDALDILATVVAAVEGVVSIFTLPLALGLAIGTLLMVLASVLANGIFGHLIARALGGEGTTPYLIYHLVGAYQLPLLILYVLFMIGLILMFIVGMPFTIVGYALGGLSTLVLLVLSLRVIGRINRAYFGLGFGKAYLTQLIAGVPVAIILLIIGGVVGLLINPLVAQALQSIPPELLPAETA